MCGFIKTLHSLMLGSVLFWFPMHKKSHTYTRRDREKGIVINTLNLEGVDAVISKQCAHQSGVCMFLYVYVCVCGYMKGCNYVIIIPKADKIGIVPQRARLWVHINNSFRCQNAQVHSVQYEYDHLLLLHSHLRTHTF